MKALTRLISDIIFKIYHFIIWGRRVNDLELKLVESGMLLTTSWFIGEILCLHAVSLTRLLVLWNRATGTVCETVLTLSESATFALVIWSGPSRPSGPLNTLHSVVTTFSLHWCRIATFAKSVFDCFIFLTHFWGKGSLKVSLWLKWTSSSSNV